MQKTEILKKQIDRATAELMRLESVPDPALMPVETVLFWQRTIPYGARDAYGVARTVEPKKYMYVALKVPNTSYNTTGDGAVWYVTGMSGNERYTDDEIRETLAHESTSDKYIVESWLSLDEYEPASPFDSDFDESVNG